MQPLRLAAKREFRACYHSLCTLRKNVLKEAVHSLGLLDKMQIVFLSLAFHSEGIIRVLQRREDIVP